MSKLTGAAKHSKAMFSGTRHMSDYRPGGEAFKRRVEKASQHRPRAGEDELHYEMLLQRTRSRHVVPFVGAGMSMPLLPSWSVVLNEVAKNLGVDLTKYKEESAPVITEILRRKANAKTCRLTPSPNELYGLSGEFQRVFEKCIGSKTGKSSDSYRELRSVLIDGAMPTGIPVDPALLSTCQSAMNLPMALLHGPWPLIMTTNWDTLLEAAYHYRNGLFLGSPKDSVLAAHFREHDQLSDRHYHSRLLPPQVRYRANVQQVFAELRAGLNPPRLLKLHGDFTERGRQEMVAGHADYRHLMVHEVAFARLMHHICSNYSLLFFGCSLTDRDLLATLDSMVESLGGEVGPHFWLTADDVSDDKVDFLQRHYSVFTIRTPEKEQFTEAGHLLENACIMGWEMTKPLKFKALSFGVGNWVQGGAELRLILESSKPEDVMKRSTPAVPVVVGVSCGYDDEGYPIFGRQGQDLLHRHRLDLPQDARVPIISQDKKGLWRTMPWQVGGKKVEGSGGSLVNLFVGLQLYIQGSSWRIYNGDLNPPEDSSESSLGNNSTSDKSSDTAASPAATVESEQTPSEHDSEAVDKAAAAAAAAESKPPKPSRIVLCLPLQKPRVRFLDSHEVLSATVSAIGNISMQCLPPCPIDIVLCLSTSDSDAQHGRLALMADIQGGRMAIGDILSRSVSGHMEFTCIAPPVEDTRLADGNGAVTEDQRNWRCRRIVIPLNATLNDLRRRMDFIVGRDYQFDTGKDSLVSLEIYDGSVVKLNANGVVVE